MTSLTAANPGGFNVLTSYSYNKRRLLTTEQSANGATVYPLTYTYNPNAHLQSLTYPDARVEKHRTPIFPSIHSSAQFVSIKSL